MVRPVGVILFLALLTAGCSAGAAAPDGEVLAPGVLGLLETLHEPLPTSSGAAPATAPLVLTPEPCAAVSRSDRGPDNPCPELVLRAGGAAGREFVAAIGFDLTGARPGRAVAYAALELTGADAAFLEGPGRWLVRMVDLPPDARLADASFARLLAAPDAVPGVSWIVAPGDVGPGRRNLLELDAAARAGLATRLGRGRVAFVIEPASGAESLFGWAASGVDGPRLTIEAQPAIGAGAR